tara:strand:+ start:336 stop:527 length:192 start_codon:yes stop_codon:yes gene_type:complete
VLSARCSAKRHHFHINELKRTQYAYDRYSNLAKRFYQVLDRRLEEPNYVAADEYTITDLVIAP